MKSSQLSSILLLSVCSACVSNIDDTSQPAEQALSSDKATLLDFEFDGELLTNRTAGFEAEIKSQLHYTVGVLNERNGVGRLDALKLTNIVSSADASGRTLVKYHVSMPVAWPAKFGLPTTFKLTLPKDVSSTGLSRFLSKYGKTCIDLWSAHDVSTGNYWYYYRTGVRNCVFDPSDVTTSVAAASVSTQNTDGSYPEYDRIWEDKTLNAIVIYGKDRNGATTISDFGISQYGLFNAKLKAYGAGIKLTSTPANIPGAPGVEFPDVEWDGVYPDGRKLHVNAMLVDNVRDSNPRFDARYAELSQKADLIIYNGHAALGDNVRALTRKGRFVRGQYTLVSMMGCDSFAYVDGFMADQRKTLNPDDPNGTKYLDIITNITPANPTWLTTAALETLSRLGDVERPSTFVQIFRGWESQHRAVVTGDEDNTFKPKPKL
jgi:hypothetical protein